MVGRKGPQAQGTLIRNLTGFGQVDENDSLMYLGVPLYQGRPTAKHFEKIKKKATTRIDGWSSKLTLYRGNGAHK